MNEALNPKKDTPQITDYDEFNYDYSTFWNHRDYEDKAEKNVLKKTLKKRHGDWFIDIGGSYGRNIDLYRRKYHNAVLMDYSIKALKQARQYLKKNSINNIVLVAANAYNLPFKENSFDGGMMIRVLHHIEKPKKVFNEISKIFKKNGVFILEFANKMHLKAVFRAILTLNLKFLFSKKPYLQPSKGANEGTNDKAKSLIYNFHPRFVSKNLKLNNLRVSRRFSLSFLRLPFIKKAFPLKSLIIFEKIFQTILFWTQITPSLIYLTKKTTHTSSKKKNLSKSNSRFNSTDIIDIICCPKCKRTLQYKGTKLRCNACNLDFSTKGRIYDLRYPKPNV